MIIIKTNEEVELIRRSSLLVSKTLAELASHIKVGSNALKIDRVAEEFIRDNGGTPAFKGYRGFPNTLCVSKNEAVVHGIPDAKEFKEGDIVSVDCGVLLDGFYGDSAYTFCLVKVDDRVTELVKTTLESLYLGIEKACVGNRVGDISHAIQDHCESKHPFSCVRELVGHGVGRSLHEEPEVPNYGRKGNGPKLLENMVIAIEPMVNLGKRGVVTASDEWTIITRDRLPSVHFEHTVAIKPEKADILTTFDDIEKAIKKNSEIVQIQ